MDVLHQREASLYRLEAACKVRVAFFRPAKHTAGRVSGGLLLHSIILDEIQKLWSGAYKTVPIMKTPNK
jgi:hypothetical protein